MEVKQYLPRYSRRFTTTNIQEHGKIQLYTIIDTFTQNFAKTIHSYKRYRGFRIHHIPAM